MLSSLDNCLFVMPLIYYRYYFEYALTFWYVSLANRSEYASIVCNICSEHMKNVYERGEDFYNMNFIYRILVTIRKNKYNTS